MRPLSAVAINPDDCVVLFLDLQAGIVELAKTNPLDKLRKSVRLLAQLAKVFDMPVLVSAVREGNKDAEMLHEIADELGSYSIHYRTTCDSFRNDEVVSAIQKTGRKTLLLSGVASELAVQLPALTASREGYRVFIVVDACGGVNERTERAAFDRVQANGCHCVSMIALAGEVAGDLREERGQKAVGILFQAAQG